MKPREDLFDLIHSMSAAERRHFKLNAQRYSPIGMEKKYVLMFDAMARQNQYDEAALRLELTAEIPAKSFTSWKRHLLEYVETAIREFHAGKESIESVQENLRDADLMFRRGLWARAQRKIAESRAIAHRMGDLLALLKIIETERRLVIQFQQKGIEAKMKALMQEARETMAHLQREQAYAEIFDEIGLLVRLKFDPRNPEVVEKVPRFLADPRLQPTTAFPNFRSERYYHQARAFLYHLADMPVQEFETYHILRQRWEAHPAFKQAYPKQYKLALTNYLNAAFKLGRWDHFPAVRAAIAAMPPENKDEAAEEFQTVEFYHHLYLLDRRELKAALALIPTIESGLRQYQAKVNHARWLSFRINIALTYFMNGDTAAAYGQINKILSQAKSDQRTDAQALAKLLEPILIFELHDATMAHQKLHALKEWLRTNERLYAFERILLSNLEQLFNATLERQTAIYHQLQAALKTIQQQGKAIQGLEVIAIWAEAKATNKPIPQIFTNPH
jgi:hypothetical protein